MYGGVGNNTWQAKVTSAVVSFKQKTAYGINFGDWSSDVCSSDLQVAAIDVPYQLWQYKDQLMMTRQEEIGRGRVGKECRSRWSPYH